VTATAYTAVGVILAGCAAYAWDVLDGRGRVSTAILRVRWAWRCRGCPPPRRGPGRDRPPDSRPGCVPTPIDPAAGAGHPSGRGQG
jgi:hypothetical protein